MRTTGLLKYFVLTSSFLAFLSGCAFSGPDTQDEVNKQIYRYLKQKEKADSYENRAYVPAGEVVEHPNLSHILFDDLDAHPEEKMDYLYYQAAREQHLKRCQLEDELRKKSGKKKLPSCQYDEAPEDVRDFVKPKKGK